MASVGTRLLFLAVLCINAGNAFSFINVECKADNCGQYGQPSMLDCVVKTAPEAADAKILVVTWKKDGVVLAVFNRGVRTEEPRFRFAKPFWDDNHMNVSLLITTTKTTDIGSYECSVITDSGGHFTSTSLRVTAKYNTPTVTSHPAKNIPPNTDVTLVCNSDGGYPEGELRWLDEHNQDWTRSSEPEVKRTEDGLFSLSSNLTLLRGSIFSKYTCAVRNATGTREGEVTFDIPKTSQIEGEVPLTSSKIVAPVVVIGSLIVGLLLVSLILKRRSRRGNQDIPMHDAEKGGLPEMEPCVQEGTTGNDHN
ncbi:CD276 antigen isoform X2 [Centroberyx affinis]|uniref:CD276 antigen isoform X2 n=1 Tax=Centroberyx affinis TaxID=166261 RepID=UPI003A5C4B8B